MRRVHHFEVVILLLGIVIVFGQILLPKHPAAAAAAAPALKITDWAEPLQGMLLEGDGAFLILSSNRAIRVRLGREFALAVRDRPEVVPGREGFWMVKFSNTN